MRNVITALVCAAIVAAGASRRLSAQAGALSIDIDHLPPNASVRLDTGGGLPPKSDSGTASASGALHMALDLGNLGKIDTPVEVYVGDCPDHSVRVALVAQGQEPPPECNRRKIGAFWWTKTHHIAIRYPGSLSTGGMSASTKILLAAGGGAVAVAALAHGGSADSGTPAAPATPGSPAAPSTPPPPTTSSTITGTFIGKATLQTDALTCKGSDPEYNEKATVNINASGSGTITLSDTPGFDRTYNVTNVGPSGFSTQGTFSFLGSSVPATLTGSFSSGSGQATLIEQTTWGSCINRYQSVLSKQ
jgi:hypothetical protein